MASEGNPDSRSFRMDNRLLLLKDYLLDDLNSCSSNGFKSFPRRHCCTTVRFLVDKDLKSRPPSKRTSVHKTAASSAITAFQKASEAVLNAVKLLSVHNRGSSVKSGFIARSFSRKVFKRSFWKKSVDGRKIKDSEIHRWKTFHNLISEFPETPTHTPTAIATIPTTTTTTSTTNSTDENSKSSSWTWSDNEFNSEYLQSSIHDDDSDSVKKLGDRSGEETGGVPADAASTSFAAPVDKPMDWMAKDDQKEQFSPVSVLESDPFHCEEGDSISSPDFVRVKGTIKKVIQRLGRFETLAKMEPAVDLDKMHAVALSDIEDKESNDIKAEVAHNMLDLVKLRIPAPSETNPTFCVDNLLLDFFMDSFLQEQSDHQITEVAESYLTGKVKKMVFDWKVEKARNIYIQDMERGRTWKHVDDQRVELGMEIEEGIWNSLVNDLVRELD